MRTNRYEYARINGQIASGIFVSSDTAMQWRSSSDAVVKQLAQCRETLYADGGVVIILRLDRSQWLRMELLDACGRRVCNVLSKENEVGTHFRYHACNLQPGCYMLRVQTQDYEWRQPVISVR